MVVTLNRRTLTKPNKKVILQLFLESKRNEDELRGQPAALMAELKRTKPAEHMLLENRISLRYAASYIFSEMMHYDEETCQQMELNVVCVVCFNEAEVTLNRDSPEELDVENVAISTHKRKKTGRQTKRKSEASSPWRTDFSYYVL